MTSFDTCVIETTDGPIRGSIEKNGEVEYYKFKKIPYAKPPLGPLRFRAPCPVVPWKEEIDCTQEAPLPLHYANKQLLGSEDCLYVEVSTKSIKPENLLPVMFWIGSYNYSSTVDHILDSTLLNDHGVVFVRCGFRLGPFGFLSIKEFTAPGNSGLKDLVMALKWVQKHIDKFGGDPNNVTIFGSSTGGTAVHLLTLSTLASGLFHKAIIQNASAISNWAISKNPVQPVMELSAKLGITNTNMIEVVEELRTFPAEDIMQAFLDLQVDTQDVTNLFDAFFKPCIEVEVEGLPAFLTKGPLLTLKTGNFNKVPLMIGNNNDEASVLQYLKSDFYDDFQKFNDNFSLFVPKSLSGHDTTIAKILGPELLTFYVGANEKFTEKTRGQYIQMITDYYFSYFINKTVGLHKECAPECTIFYYILNAAGCCVPYNLEFFNCHGPELLFIFRIKTSDPQISKDTQELITTRYRVVKMWTNFAKYGNPTPDEDDPLLQVKWDPVENKEKLNYLSIGSELTKGRNPFQDRMQFWEKLHYEYPLVRMQVHFYDLGVTW